MKREGEPSSPVPAGAAPFPRPRHAAATPAPARTPSGAGPDREAGVGPIPAKVAPRLLPGHGPRPRHPDSAPAFAPHPTMQWQFATGFRRISCKFMILVMDSERTLVK